jgi:hypothetical protein
MLVGTLFYADVPVPVLVSIALTYSTYEITWDTQPVPVMHRKNAEEVTELVANFIHCIKFRLLQGYVGVNLLWEKDAAKATSSAPSPDQTTKPSLQYGMVRHFDPLMDKYKILFWTGIWTWKTEEDVKRAHKFTDIVITGSMEVGVLKTRRLLLSNQALFWRVSRSRYLPLLKGALLPLHTVKTQSKTFQQVRSLLFFFQTSEHVSYQHVFLS